MIITETIEAGPVATNAYVVCNLSTHLAFCVDAPPQSAEAILDVVRNHSCKLTDVLLTHTHWDHTADCSPLVKQTGAKLSVHALDAYRLLDPNRHTVWPLTITLDRVVPDNVFSGNQRIHPAGIGLHVVHTPGHTEGGVCFIDEANERVFVGDTLFAGSVGRTDLPGGDMDVLIQSIHSVLMTLPDNYLVLPGHGPTTTIGRERTSNPFVTP